MKKRSNYIIGIFLLFIGLTCFGCARQNNSESAADSSVTGAQEEFGDELDMLLADDFHDDDIGSDREYSDPLEPMNRVFFEFNDKLYYLVLNPLNTAYTAVLPWDLRYAIGNFVNNVAAPVRLLNNLLQWKLADAGVVLSRFIINSTLGVFGFGDPALTDFDLEPRPEDFGQTLGVWGVGEGIYLCLPVLGPLNVRDTVGFAADAFTHPMVYFIEDLWVSGEYYALSRVNLLSLNPDVYEELKKYSLDPYISMRQVYLDYRRNKISDSVWQQRSDNQL
jgi:phospholipid-binding lipoprotein MlaA